MYSPEPDPHPHSHDITHKHRWNIHTQRHVQVSSSHDNLNDQRDQRGRCTIIRTTIKSLSPCHHQFVYKMWGKGEKIMTFGKFHQSCCLTPVEGKRDTWSGYPRTGVSERIVLWPITRGHVVITLVTGNTWSGRFVGSDSWWGTGFSDDVVTFWLGHVTDVVSDRCLFDTS